MSYIPSSGSVVAFQSNADNLKASVQGTVGASIIGQVPVNISNTNLNVSGSVVAFQSNPSVLRATVHVENTGADPVPVMPPASGFLNVATQNSSVITVQSGINISSLVSTVPSSVLVGASIFGQLPAGTAPLGSVAVLQGTNPFIITGSVQTTVQTGNSSVQVLNFPTNQNISGSVVAFQGGTVIASISGVPNIQGKDAPVASITGNPVYIAGKDANGSVAGIQVLNGAVLTVGSVSGSVGIVGNPSISGTVGATQQGTWVASVQVLNFPANQSVSGAITQGTNPWIITGSVQTTVTTGNSSVQVLNNPLVITGSVQGTVGASIIGTVPITVVDGTRISSLVSTVPSSVLVGASIFGTAPVTQSGAWSQSVVGIIAPSAAVTSVKTATSVTTLITSNTARRGVAISNNSATSILVKLGGMNTVNDYSLVMFVNDYYEVPFNYSGAVSHYASSVAGLVYITEIT